MVNHFISSVRNRRQYSDLDQMPEVSIPASQHDRTELRDLNVVFQHLPKEHRQALHLIGIEEQSYEEAADATGCSIGPLKNRVHRARLLLRPQMYGEIRDAA
jgi:RNA polymerase sigma-70 factor, ECF subfamily